jgi:GntR family transcriptional regulator/MocR family aminotransferase
VVVSGSQQALDFAARVLLDPGDEAWMEDPGYAGARAALAGSGARVVPVPVDEEGLDVAAGEDASPEARLVCVTPSHQYPSGVTMTLERRLALLEWADRAGAWVVEDDYDSEYRYSGRPLEALQGLDPSGDVVYVGTFSMVLSPGSSTWFPPRPACTWWGCCPKAKTIARRPEGRPPRAWRRHPSRLSRKRR